MKNLRKFSALLLVFTLFWSCADDDEEMVVLAPTTPTMNIVETAQANAELSLLVDAVIIADLAGALTTPGDNTVFAPTNAAFEALLATNDDWNSLDDVPVDALKQILLNHVIAGANIPSSALAGTTGYTNTSATGPNDAHLSLYYDGTDGVKLNGMSTVITADISTTNGIVHVVDTVITLPTIATFATTNPALTSLVSALVYADSGTPTVPYIETVSNATAGPFTVFAPTNAAFVNALVELDATALSDLGTAVVDSAITYHIVAGANVQSSQLMSGPVATLGGDITADATAFTLTDVNDRVSNIETSLVDIQAINGVVHVIDKVLLP